MRYVRTCNNVIRDPFMLLSFLALSVIPSLKLTDKGLLDIEKFHLTNLWVQSDFVGRQIR